MPPHPLSLLLWRTSLLGCFLGIVATLYFIAGYNGYLSAPLLNAAVAGSVLLAALYFLYGFACQLRSRPRLHLLLWFLVLGVLLAEVTLGLVPPWARDELTHHLAIPRLYASAGRIFSGIAAVLLYRSSSCIVGSDPGFVLVPSPRVRGRGPG